MLKTQFAQKTANFAKAAGQRARGLVRVLKARIGGFVNGAMQRARDVANQGRGLLGKVMGPFMGMATKAFDAVQSRVSQAVNMVKTEAQRSKDVALKVGSKIADTTRKAGNLLKEFTQSAIQKGRQAVQKARQWSSQQLKKATELGSRLVTQARKRVADLVRNGVKLAKEKAIPFIKQKLGGVKQRIKNFLQDKWNRLKEKLGIKNPDLEDVRKLVKDKGQLQRLLNEAGNDPKKLKNLLQIVDGDAKQLEQLIKDFGVKALDDFTTHLTPQGVKSIFQAGGREGLQLTQRIVELEKKGKINGIKDWAAFAITQQNKQGDDMLRSLNELREAERMALDAKSGAVVQIGNDLHGAGVRTFDNSLDQGGTTIRNVEVTSVDGLATQMSNFNAGIHHGIDKAKALPPGAAGTREASIYAEFPTKDMTRGNYQLKFTPDGKYQMFTKDGSRHIKDGDVISELVQNMKKIKDNNLLTHVNIYSKSDNGVIVILENQGGTWVVKTRR